MHKFATPSEYNFEDCQSNNKNIKSHSFSHDVFSNWLNKSSNIDTLHNFAPIDNVLIDSSEPYETFFLLFSFKTSDGKNIVLCLEQDQGKKRNNGLYIIEYDGENIVNKYLISKNFVSCTNKNLKSFIKIKRKKLFIEYDDVDQGRNVKIEYRLR
jgi:hypothetical protein